MAKRQRNTKPAKCHKCGADVKPGEGWLYMDSARNRFTTRPLWLTRCEACHAPSRRKRGS